VTLTIKLLKIIAVVLIIGLLAVLPILIGEFQLYLIIEFFTFALFAVSWNFLYRYSGMLSFGHGAFFAIGAYACGLIINQVSTWPISLLISLVGGAFVAGLASLVLGYICTRSTETYFAILTLVFSMVIYSLLLQWRNITGGDDGLLIAYKRYLFGIDFSLASRYYYWALAVTAVSITLLWIFTKSYYGQVIMAIRENPERAEFVGVPVRKYRLWSFTIGGFFAGIAGSIYALLVGLITPTLSYWTKSAEAIFMSLMGGPNYFVGPIVGAGIYLLLKERVMAYTEYWRLVMGTAIVILVLFTPEGLLGTFRALKIWKLGSKRPRAQKGTEKEISQVN